MTDPCRRCGAESVADIWETPVCRECHSLWGHEAPTSGEVEAKAKPEHFHVVEFANGMKYRQLRPGLLEAYYRKWTAQWVAKSKAVAA